MPHADQIQLLNRNEINDSRWDECISNAANGFLYSFTWYLDQFAENWFGLVYKDYEMVMAFPFKKKMGISYVYHPALVPHLGLIGNNAGDEIFHAFMNCIPGMYKLIDYTVNNAVKISTNGCTVTPAANYTLSLQPSYTELSGKYNTNTIRNIAKQTETGVARAGTTDVIALAKKQFSQFPGNVLAALDRYITLNNNCPEMNRCRNYGIFNKENELEAAASIMFSHNRLYYLVAANAAEARKSGASHKIVDAIIKDHAGRNLLLDFEGSDIPGVAFFYSGFGASAGFNQKLHINKLNALLRFLTAK